MANSKKRTKIQKFTVLYQSAHTHEKCVHNLNNKMVSSRAQRFSCYGENNSRNYFTGPQVSPHNCPENSLLAHSPLLPTSSHQSGS